MSYRPIYHKILWHATDIIDKTRHAKGCQFKVPGVCEPRFNRKSFKLHRDAYIRRPNGIYDNTVIKEGVDYFHGFACLMSPQEVEAISPDGTKLVLNTDAIGVATGSCPTVPSDAEIPGASLGTDSDGFFDPDSVS